uniref:Somatostatin receptor type 5-like n=1 Tax=Crassostrea virginica TaxID=6565 RepID=A0A8B8DKE5_CRAVI|nr:somatostatin receptor type 5-like [Crassostrea virginica]XP_022328651.1 somatostatin receptor type 5-like [Crassostrea virginica]
MANSSVVNETATESNGRHDYDPEDGYFSSSFVLPCSDEFPYHCSVAISALCIALVGIIGNLTVIGSMIREKLYKKTSHMSILVLAVTDILCLLVFSAREFIYFPNEFYFIKNYTFSGAACVAIFVLNNTPYLSSCWNVMYLAYERYVLVTNPFIYMDKHTPTIVVIRAVVTFIMIGLLNLGYAVIMVNLSQCPDFILIPVYYGFVTVPIIGISLFSLVFFHCSKVYKLKKLSNVEGRHSQNTKQYPHMTRIVYTIVIIFILSQIPYLIFDVVSIYESFDNNLWPMEYYDVILNIGIVAFLLNYSSNPFIYWLTPLGSKCNCKRVLSKRSRETSSINQTKISVVQ